MSMTFSCQRLHATITPQTCLKRRRHPDYGEYCRSCAEGAWAEQMLGVAVVQPPPANLPEVGSVFGSWVFLGRGDYRHQHPYWRMMCRECGGECEVRAHYARQGISTRCRSCAGRAAARRRWRA